MSRGLRSALSGLFAIVAIVAILAITAGCAAREPAPAPVTGAPRDTLVVLPLENLSGRAEYGERLTRILWTEVSTSARWDVVPEGELDAALAEARVRSSMAMTLEQVRQVAKRTGARWLLAGTIIECGQVKTPDGEVPSLALALRLIDGETARVRWTEQRTSSGEDRETVFGWGRVTSLERLAMETSRELVAAIRLPAAPDSLAPGGR